MKKILTWLAKGFLGIMLLFLTTAWVRWHLDTSGMIEQFQIMAETSTGLNALKTGMSGAVLIIALFITLYFIKGQYWLYPLIVSAGALIIARALSAIQDGVSDLFWVGMIFEIFIVVAGLFLKTASTPKLKDNQINPS